jgi:flagellar protein FlbT
VEDVMALVVELKPGERLILGNFLVTVAGDQRARLEIAGEGPVLREGDVIAAGAVDTPAKRLYLAVELMYLAGDIGAAQAEFLTLARDLVEAAPSTTPYIARAADHILAGELYKALREMKGLIAYERTLLGDDSADEGAAAGAAA